MWFQELSSTLIRRSRRWSNSSLRWPVLYFPRVGLVAWLLGCSRLGLVSYWWGLASDVRVYVCMCVSLCPPTCKIHFELALFWGISAPNMFP